MIKKPVRKIITFDWAIKTVLRDKANFDVLEGFLSALLARPITILDMLKSESNREDGADKYNRVDLLAKTGDGEGIIVEVRYLSEMAYLEHRAFGAAKTIVENLELGDPYDNVKKVYSVSLVYFDVSREENDDYIYHGKTDFMCLHTRQSVRLKDSLARKQVRINGTNILPEYYFICVKRFPDIVRDDLDEWVWAFKHNEVPEEFISPGIHALKDKFDYLGMNEIERGRFEAHIDRVRSEWGMIAYAREEGFEEGRRIGRQKALEESRKRGKEKGARDRSLEIARALKKKGLLPGQIAELTGISLSELEGP
uniref:Rpn family recombination-promoting nuclease/putative transposase n=1 Tax=Candidatus Kentrum sp. FW TaxID=2126338 RepID=A0A450RT05_9GAMM|nr:MAG: conserved hypothetical protein (putative transposase or invertase) [Candidatus Kentron sp. FW]